MPRLSFTTNSEGTKALPFQCSLFFAPIAAALIFTAGMLWHVGELMSPDAVVKMQQRSRIIYLPQFQEWPRFSPGYLLQAVSRRRPEILVFGSSRVKGVGSAFFREPPVVFNAGLPATTVSVGTWRHFLESLPPDYSPRYVLIDLDPWWFRQAAIVQDSSALGQPYSSMDIIDFAWRRGFWWSVDQLRSRAVIDPGYLGVQAIARHQGVQPDGSFFLPKNFVPPKMDAGARAGAWPWMHDSETLSSSAVHELNRFLSFCERRGIRVVGFMSSFRPEYYAAVQQEPGLRYMRSLKPTLAPLFEQVHGAFFDYLDPASTGCPELGFVDPLHESEVCTVRMLFNMAERNEAVASLVDFGKLKVMLQNRKSDWQLDF